MLLVSCSSEVRLPPEPPLPADMSGFDAAIVERIEQAAEEIRRAPGSDRHWLELGMLYHAHERFDLAIEYLYRPLPGTPEEEARALDAIAARAEIEPGLIYDGGGLGAIDPTTSADDLGDDPIGFAETRLTMIREEVLGQAHPQ